WGPGRRRRRGGSGPSGRAPAASRLLAISTAGWSRRLVESFRGTGTGRSCWGRDSVISWWWPPCATAGVPSSTRATTGWSLGDAGMWRTSAGRVRRDGAGADRLRGGEGNVRGEDKANWPPAHVPPRTVRNGRANWVG